MPAMQNLLAQNTTGGIRQCLSKGQKHVQCNLTGFDLPDLAVFNLIYAPSFQLAVLIGVVRRSHN